MKKKQSLYNRFMTSVSKLIFRKAEVIWHEPLQQDEVAIFACNHSAAIGPAYTTLYLDIPKRPWVVSYALDKKKSVKFAFHDMLFAKDKKCKPFFWTVAFFIAKLLPPILLNNDPIPVHHSSKMVETFSQSIETLTKMQKSLVIFPEKPEKYSEFIFELYDGFVDLGLQYYKETNKKLRFFPTYVCGDLKKIVIGKPITYDIDSKPKEQRKIISSYIKENIDMLARQLPKHKSVPFLPDVWFKSYGEYAKDIAKYWELFD